MKTLSKIVSQRTLIRRLQAERQAGKTIAFTNGCFDLMHYGHVRYLETAQKNNRVLVIGLNSDRSVRSIKGPKRPINGEHARAAVLAALACVHYVTLFEEDTPESLIMAVKPDVLIKGADWKGKTIAGAAVVKANGGRVEFIKFEDGFSTTKMIKTILRTCKND